MRGVAPGEIAQLRFEGRIAGSPPILSGHDRAVLRAEVQPLIEALLPGARYAELLDLDWRPGFEREAQDWLARADDWPASSEARRECLRNAAAREFVLAEVI
ncbi:MAG: hypothetical protein ACXVYM_08825 [Gaiellaceae bacterium]